MQLRSMDEFARKRGDARLNSSVPIELNRFPMRSKIQDDAWWRDKSECKQSGAESLFSAHDIGVENALDSRLFVFRAHSRNEQNRKLGDIGKVMPACRSYQLPEANRRTDVWHFD